MSTAPGAAPDIAQASWFAAVGEPLSASEIADAEGYLRGLGLDGVRVAPVSSWHDAGRALRDPGWDRRWWDAVERARTTLLDAACAARGRESAMAALSEVVAAATRTVAGPAAEAAAAAGVADQGLIKAAAGAAAEAAYQAALARAAAAPADHPFALRFNLFAAGHWPLAVVGARFDVF